MEDITENGTLPRLNRSKLLRDQAYEALRDSILDGSVPPGYRLVEDELAERLSVSRTPVREAIQRLQVEGLVVASSSRGFEVAPIDSYDIEGALDIRLLLESYAVQEAATRVTARQLEELKDICRQEADCLKQDGPELADELQELNRRFHDQFVACADNRTLTTLVRYLQGQPAYRLFALGNPGNLQLFVESHCRLVRMLAEHDADAAKAEIAYHINLARQILMQGRGPQHPSDDV
jgi:DNA-binding GntR family transcriptional regulator